MSKFIPDMKGLARELEGGSQFGQAANLMPFAPPTVRKQQQPPLIEQIRSFAELKMKAIDDLMTDCRQRLASLERLGQSRRNEIEATTNELVKQLTGWKDEIDELTLRLEKPREAEADMDAVASIAEQEHGQPR
jgi:hypothetical protein